jgi:hypothetical protein
MIGELWPDLMIMALPFLAVALAIGLKQWRKKNRK